MKILTNKQYEKLVEDSFREGHKEGYKKGHRGGLYEGLTADKTGVHFNSSGIFVFNDGETETVKTVTEEIKI